MNLCLGIVLILKYTGKYDDGDTGNERYYIDISSLDYYNDPNNCYSLWDGMQHSLRIIKPNEIENNFNI